MKNAKYFTLTYLPALGVNQILLEHGQADQEGVLLVRLDIGQVAAQVLTQLLALPPGQASGCKHLVMHSKTFLVIGVSLCIQAKSDWFRE